MTLVFNLQSWNIGSEEADIKLKRMMEDFSRVQGELEHQKRPPQKPKMKYT